MRKGSETERYRRLGHFLETERQKDRETERQRDKRDLHANLPMQPASNEYVKKYMARAHELVKPGGKMVITSCNFSAEVGGVE